MSGPACTHPRDGQIWGSDANDVLHDDAASADAGRDRIVSVLSSLFENCGCCERDVLDDEALYCLGCGTLINRLGPMPTGHEEF